MSDKPGAPATGERTRRWRSGRAKKLVALEFGRDRMTTRVPRYSGEEFAQRGQEIYERIVRAALQPGDDGKFVAIDIESGNYEMDPDDYTATERLLNRLPDAQIWLMRVGQKAAHRFGMGSDSRRAE